MIIFMGETKERERSRQKRMMKQPSAFTPEFLLLLAVSWAVELLGGAAFMHWYWSSSGTRFADVAAPLLQSMGVRQASPNGVILSLLACSLLLHLLYACWHSVCGPFLQRWRLGVRAPTRQEQQKISEAMNLLG